MTLSPLPHQASAAPIRLRQWQPATWEDYLAYRDAPTENRSRLFFDQGLLWVDMGEGINHAGICNLFTMVFVLWFSQHPDLIATSLGGCQMEKSGVKAVAPDLVLYLGAGFPQWQTGEPRYLSLNQWRVPDLVGEISDTTLADDLDEKKQIYAELGIPEYWVINVQGNQVFAFRLQETGKYQQIEQSIALLGLPIALLKQTLERLTAAGNINAALWFFQQLTVLQPRAAQ